MPFSTDIPSTGDADQNRKDGMDDADLPGGETRLVSLLIADVGLRDAALSAADGEATADIEEVQDILRACLHIISREAERYGGAISRHSTGAVIGVFGHHLTPASASTRASDSKQAVTAALSIQAALADIHQRSIQTGGSGIDIKLGVVTGYTVVQVPDAQTLKSSSAKKDSRSAGRAGTFSEAGAVNVSGELVARAEQLRGLCPAGKVLISAPTYRDTLDIVDAEALSGNSDVYLITSSVLQIRRNPARGLPGLATHLVGRDAELNNLRRLYRRVRLANAVGVVGIVGHGGIGKSRLMKEFVATLPAGDIVRLQARCTQPSQNTAYHLFRDLFTALFAMHRSPDQAVDLTDKSAAEMQTGTASSAIKSQFLDGLLTTVPKLYIDSMIDAELLAQLLGFGRCDDLSVQNIVSNSTLVFQRASSFLVRFFGAFAASHSAKTLIFTVDDLHWADTASLALLEKLLRSHELFDQPLRLTVILLSQPDERTGLFFERIGARIFSLRPLSAEASGKLVREIFEMRGAAQIESQTLDRKTSAAAQDAENDAENFERLVRFVQERSEGMPFYIEELMRMIFDGGLPGSGRYDSAPNHAMDFDAVLERFKSRTPDTLQGLLHARIDSLPRPAKSFLQLASCLGRHFSTDVLAPAAMASFSLSASEVQTMLHQLCESDFITAAPSFDLQDEVQYQFFHELLRDAFYESITMKTRRAYHRTLASLLIAKVRVKASPMPAAPEAVFAEGFSRATEAVRSPQLTLLPVIAAHLERAGDTAGAVKHYAEAGHLSKQQYANRLAYDCYTKALTLLDAAQDDFAPGTYDRLRFDLIINRFRVSRAIDQAGAVAADLDTLASLAGRIGEAALQVAVHIEIASYASFNGRYAEAIHHAEVAMELAEQHGERKAHALSLYHLGSAHQNCGRHHLAVDDYERALNLTDNTDAVQQELCLNGLGFCYFELSMFDRALAYHQRALEINQAIGYKRRIANSLSHIANVYMSIGYYAEGLGYHAAAERIAEEIDDKLIRGVAAHNFGDHYLQSGDTEKAAIYFERALTLNRAIGRAHGELINLLSLGDTRLRQGLFSQAAQSLAAALPLAIRIGEQPQLAVYYHLNAQRYFVMNELQPALENSAEAVRILEDPEVQGIERPYRIYFLHHRILAHLGHLEANLYLQKAATHLQMIAQNISNADFRSSFLSHVLQNRELVLAYRQGFPNDPLFDTADLKD
ncbi:MAG: tetratricopeptide repeat protein [Rhizobacter sp.]|nr:tetratricopeptide repeat protein [Chlorobiales bacterium]